MTAEEKIHTADLDAMGIKVGYIVENCDLAGQLEVAQEECAEMIQAISKYRRYGESRLDNLAEEMADVLNLISQLASYFDLQDDIYAWLDRKLDRTIEKINNGEIGKRAE